MKRTLVFAALLTGSLAAAQVNIPALPPGSTTPTTPSQTTPSQTSPSQTTVSSDPTLPSGYKLSQLQAVLPLLNGLRTLTGSTIDQARGRVVLSGLSAVERVEVLRRLTAAGLPGGVVTFTGTAASGGTATTGTTGTPTAPTTPTTSAPNTSLPMRYPLLPQAHTATVSGPATVTPGQALTWDFTLTNTGTATIHLEHGACDVRFEVVSASGVVVRPDPTNTVCTMQLVVTDIQPGESMRVQNLRWDGKDTQGLDVAPGTYTLRAEFSGAGVRSVVGTLTVTVQ